MVKVKIGKYTGTIYGDTYPKDKIGECCVNETVESDEELARKKEEVLLKREDDCYACLGCPESWGISL